MSFRRNGEKADCQRTWERFCEDQMDRIQLIGLPDPVVSTQDRFVDFLMHGYIDHHFDPMGYSVHQMSDEQNEAFGHLVNNYIERFGDLPESELIALSLARFPKG